MKRLLNVVLLTMIFAVVITTVGIPVSTVHAAESGSNVGATGLSAGEI